MSSRSRAAVSIPRSQRRFYIWLGAVITACGVAGLAAAAAGAPAAVIAATAAITPGVILLTSSFLLIGRYRSPAGGWATFTRISGGIR